uniref:CFA44 protein n=1 Tax=Junco hyemalis TaxID=40217 RepID=A0A8C5JTQ5_JUNHY
TRGDSVEMWNFEIVDTADPVDDTGLVEMEPMNELWLGKNVSLNFITKIHDQGQSFWFAQDTSGSIWKLDLTFSNMSHDPERVCTFHSGGIEAIGVSPFTCLMATTALDRTVRIYDFSSNSQLSVIKFKQGGTALAWAPAIVSPEGGLIAVGFEDGVVRMIEVYDPTLLPGHEGQANEIAEINLKQVFKPHAAAVTALAYEPKGYVFATGSKDKTVFFFAVKNEYRPIGFICVPGPVQALQWSPPSHDKSTLLILCENGFAVQVPAPHHGKQYTVTTYHIVDLPTQYFHFYSVKSQIKVKNSPVAEFHLLHCKEKEEKEKARLEWIKQQKELGIEVEETKEEEAEEEPLPPVYIPEEPSPILCGFYSAPGKFWLSLRGLEKEKATEDIKDPDAYNIEEYKQKEEHERKMKEVEEKKNKKREELSALRQDFVLLLQKNQELPKHMQLHREVHLAFIRIIYIYRHLFLKCCYIPCWGQRCPMLWIKVVLRIYKSMDF